MEIDLNTKIYDLLKEYPFLEDELIKINPKFKKLKNPVLRRTIARVAGIKQAAIVGGMEPLDLLNKIRRLVGKEEIENIEDNEQKEEKSFPIWATKEPKAIVNGNKLLDEGENPLSYINKVLKDFEQGDVLLLETDFKPAPLIDEFLKRGYEVFSAKESEDKFLTYIKK